MTGEVITLMSCNTLSDARMSLLCFKLHVLETIVESRFEILPRDVFLQVSFEQIYYAFAKKPDKLFWAKLNEKSFAFVGK